MFKIKSLLFFSLLVLGCLMIKGSSAHSCCNLFSGNDYYEFSALANKDSWSILGSDNFYYYFNICAASAKCAVTGTNSATMVLKVVQLNTMMEMCPNGTVRSTEIMMLCGTGNTQVLSVEGVSYCQYLIKMSSPLACPISNPNTTSTTCSGAGRIYTGGSLYQLFYNHVTVFEDADSPTKLLTVCKSHSILALSRQSILLLVLKTKILS
ncbi:hypothetical protein PPL_02535 [Heterostelium album PN500]|uniref:MRH domain-containing protein n=1 Tax=Heterostelium pallidum (strain ATCC 26659 / Pp 5 / PN500) TaxID=670386 RepID=D3B2C5_HETP5|nr:hypothetical protein PPL_02535 [Heterostelium album PN500]EFA84500.1 hypothetical protein PPL_02535 [Heterostelium album PN500]|eukprot:XP_020436614.1 hypothetical protein PPL_02535 [Heterostelium album PN500]